MRQIITLDFETDKIEPRPQFPPRPVGLSVKYDAAPSKYLSFGHPVGNTSTKKAAAKVLVDAWNSDAELLFHNAKFDLSICYEVFGLPQLPWDRVHDTMFLAFLADPHSKAIDLKGLADDLLGQAPDERDAVAEWVWEHRKALMEEYGGNISREKGKPQANKTSTGEWLSRVPADIVDHYACGDTDRTYDLFQHLYPLIVANGMLPAYNRERQVLPIFMENERIGIRVDTEALRRDIDKYQTAATTVEAWLRGRLGVPDLNLDADQDVAAALAAAEVIAPESWVLTKTGKRSVSKKNLSPDMYEDAEVASTFGYRNRLMTCLKMFMQPWLAQAEATGGTIHTNWNQTRGGDGGTRTGRPSTSSPNILNISKDFEGKTDGYKHPTHIPNLPPLPLVRDYVLPDTGGVFIHRDFDGQELRIFAHFECGELFAAYQRNPRLDVHAMVGDQMRDLAGKEFDRTYVKAINFQSIYGGGIPALVRELRITQQEAKEFKAFHNKALPGRVVINDEIKRVVRGGDPVRTWGGRCYFPEEPRQVDGRFMDFEYKLLNYVVQGSAADCTKEAIIRWYTHPKRHPEDRLLTTVYDEINISAPAWRIVEAMAVLRECMESIELDVIMLSSPKVGPSWGQCKKPKEEKVNGKVVWQEPEQEFMARMAKEFGR